MKFRILAVIAGVLLLALFVATQNLHELSTSLPLETERPAFGLSLWQWIAGIAAMLASAVVGYAAAVICGWVFALRDKASGPQSSPASRRGVRRSIGLSAASLFWWAFLPGLELPAKWLQGVKWAVQGVAVCAAVWLVYSLWDGLCDVMTERAASMDRRAEKLLLPLTRKLVRFLIVLGGSLIGLAWVGANVAGVLAGLGIGGLAVALAAKDSVENIFGSLTILFDMPFAIGDWVRIGPVDGVVEEINLRSTRIRTFQDSMITLPNSNLIKAAVENFGVRRFRQVKLRLSVPLDTPEESLEAYTSDLRASLRSLPRTRNEPVYVSLNDLTDLGIVVLVECFIECETYEQELAERSEVLRGMVSLARKHGIRAAGSPPAAPA